MSPGRLPINGNLPLSINKPPTIRRMIPKKIKFLPIDSMDFLKSPCPLCERKGDKGDFLTL